MDETATSSGAPVNDPVINVIEPDPPPAADPAAGASGPDRLDQAAGDALAARRRREFDAARARLRDQAIRADHARSQTGSQSPGAQGGPPGGAGDEPAMRWAPLGEAPEKVRKRYLRAGNQYFLKDSPHQLAFEDIGPYLVTEHNRADVVESMVDMVRAKAWGRIRVSGHEQFRREVWVQATLLGIEVSGYEPKAVDLARLAEGRRERMTNRIDVAGPPSAAPAPVAPAPTVPPTAPDPGAAPAGARPSPPVSSQVPPTPAASGRTAPGSASPGRASPVPGGAAPAAGTPVVPARGAEGEEPDRQRHAGTLIEHGDAPYQHNPARSDSYYVVYRDTAGADHVVWGVDLERAIAEAGAVPGEPVTLENLGRRWVTVNVPVFDATGAVIGQEEKDVYRNTWQVDVVGRDRAQLSPAASAPASPGPDSAAGQGAPVRQPERAAGQRDQSPAASGERALQLAVLVAAMREQGLGEQSITRVRQRAELMLDALQADGVAVPRPRVFDPKAPSTRSRRSRPAAERSPAREVEREPADPSPPAL
ncbi:DNA primase [Burkholderia sp. WAC0059]|uniref:LPD7 domain-containing protein n=1 Tax=Burkholderia sp. WAC0059 TaxID=2066022 RepID=UPI000C7F2166|nr:LPD7 domain-containing protein [Burkholderia sp. WAC0059]PLZ01876.1 DNA primase [Burkholderia sp. WAC0059]